MTNKIILVGRLTRDPEAKTTGSGALLSKFSVAVDNFGKDAGTTFFNCTAFAKTAEFINNYSGKGRLVYVEGRMESNKGSDDRTYWEVSVSEFKALDRPKDDAGTNTSTNTARPAAPAMDEYDPFGDE